MSVSAEAHDVDDTDGLNEEEEYEAWKLRELIRIKRNRQEMMEREKEEAEKERRRNMTDKELMEEDAKLKPQAEKETLQFMQRYYHKGAFFQDNDDEIFKRKNEPTLEDKFDKSILPEVMQVKNFGRSSRTKYTHLTKEDTSHVKSNLYFIWMPNLFLGWCWLVPKERC